jgi:predicted RNase H-like HicB family nuclease
MRYTSVIITKEGKWFVAKSVELGVVSQGKTIDQAKQNLQEAVELYLEDRPALKKELTKETPLVTTLAIGRG